MEESEPLLRLPRPLSPAAAVRVRAALQVEEGQYEYWGYSKPIVALDVAWNTAFVLLSAAVLLSTSKERPSTPIRAWVVGYAAQCLVHVGFVWFEYKRRRRRRREQMEVSRECRAVKKLESLNAMISFLWWILGFYWIVVGGQTLLEDATSLYWLAVVFLAFDVFFAIFCIMLACIIGIALCCCFPCIIAFLYVVAGQEGASDADLNMLPKFRFRPATRSQGFDPQKEQAVAITIMEADSMDELELPPEDSECCICLSQYEDGAELLSLPCKHHFHSGCIVKWLRINATCPLCKYSILKNWHDDLV